jgi:hypothetical protein
MVGEWVSRWSSGLRRGQNQSRHSGPVLHLEVLEPRTVFNVAPASNAGIILNAANGYLLEYEGSPDFQFYTATPGGALAFPTGQPPILTNGPPTIITIGIGILKSAPGNQVMWAGPIIGMRPIQGGQLPADRYAGPEYETEIIIPLSSAATANGQFADPSASLLLLSPSPAAKDQPSLARSEAATPAQFTQPAAASASDYVVPCEATLDDNPGVPGPLEPPSVSREPRELGLPVADNLLSFSPEFVSIDPVRAETPLPPPFLATPGLQELMTPPSHVAEPTAIDWHRQNGPPLAPVEQEVPAVPAIPPVDSDAWRNISWPAWSIAAGLFVVLHRKTIPIWWTRCRNAIALTARNVWNEKPTP